MAERTIVVRLRAQVADFKRDMGDATKSVGDAIRGNQEAAHTLTNQVGILGAGLVGIAAASVASYAKFEKQMSAVQAATHATGQELGALRDAAVEAGAETAFSASEAAAGIENLAKAGVATTDILNGGLDGALALAAAGNIEVADAAEIAATALTQFNLRGSDVTHVADLLAAGAGKAQGNVGDLSQALNQAGLVASGTGLSIEETTGALAAFASAGLLGSDAGTSFKTMLQVLSAPSTTAAAEMDRLGISAYDAQGQFVGLEALAGNLRVALRELTPEQRDAALATIFGSDAVRAARVIYTEGAEGIREWTEAVDDTGFAAETARIQTDNLIGDLERLGGSLDSVLIQSGSGANDVLRDMAQGAEAVVDAIGQIPAPVLSATTLIAGSGGLALLGIAGMGKLAIGIADTRAAMDALAWSSQKTRLAVGYTGTAIAAASFALAAWADNMAEASARTEKLKSTLDAYGRTTDQTLRSVNETLSNPNSVNLWEKVFGAPKENDARSAFEMAEHLQIATEDVTLAILGQADAQERVNAAIDRAKDNDSIWDTSTRSAAASLTAIIDEQRAALEKSTTEKQRAAAADEAAGVAQDEAKVATEVATAALEEQTRVAEQWAADTGAAFATFVDPAGAFQAVIDKNKEWAEATAAATESSEDSWTDFYDGQKVSSADYIAQLEAQVQAQQSWATNMTDLSSRVNGTMSGDMRDAANAMIDELMRLGPEGAAQVQLLHDMEEPELQRVVELFQRKGEASSNEFADAIENTRNPEIVVDADLSKAYGKVTSFILDTQGRTVGIRIGSGLGAIEAKAEGGPIFGPGTATSDSILARLSNGEHVWTAREVQAAGGHGAVMKLRAQTLAGYAAGGPVAADSPFARSPYLHPGTFASQAAGASVSKTYAATVHARTPVTEREIVSAFHQLELLDFRG